jgi:hypothetical protein
MITGILVICLVLALGFMTGLLKVSSPAFMKGGSLPHGQTPPEVAPGPVPEDTMTPPTEPSPAAPSFVPGPTQVPLESLQVWFQAERDPITQTVTVLFDGGKGQRAVRDVLVRLTRSDGQVLTRTFRPTTIGEGASLPGTRYTDRLEVIVTYNNGDKTTIIDKRFDYKMRN